MHTPFLVVPAVLLALVLLVSGGMKLRDLGTSEDAFVSLRLPKVWRRLKAPQVLPFGEILLALALLVVPAPVYVVIAGLAALLFVGFLVVIARALRFEEPVTCNCFGKLGLGFVDRKTLVRNAILVALALVAVGDAIAGNSVIGRFTSFGGTEWGWLTGVLVAVVLTGIIVRDGRSQPAASPAVAAPEVGDDLDYIRQPIPFGVLHELDDKQLKPLRQLAANKPTLIAMVSLGCGSCVRTMDLLPQWAAKHPIVQVIAIPAGTPAVEQLPNLGEHVTWMYDPDGNVAQLFGLGWPSTVLLGGDGLLAGGPVGGFDQIDQFLKDIAAELAEVEEQLTQQQADEPVAAEPSAVLLDEQDWADIPPIVR